MADRVGKVKIPLRGEKWVSTGVAARLAAVSTRTIQRWVERDRIRTRKTASGRFQVLVVNGGLVEADFSESRAK